MHWSNLITYVPDSSFIYSYPSKRSYGAVAMHLVDQFGEKVRSSATSLSKSVVNILPSFITCICVRLRYVRKTSSANLVTLNRVNDKITNSFFSGTTNMASFFMNSLCSRLMYTCNGVLHPCTLRSLSQATPMVPSSALRHRHKILNSDFPVLSILLI